MKANKTEVINETRETTTTATNERKIELRKRTVTRYGRTETHTLIRLQFRIQIRRKPLINITFPKQANL